MADSHEDREKMVAAIMHRYRQLCADHETAQQNVERVQAHQRELAQQINDCFAAARLFGFDLMAEFQREAKGDPRQPTLRSPDPLIPELMPVPAAHSIRNGPSIKEIVLAAAQAAYPDSVRAAQIRSELAERGHAIHEKSVGVAFYRLSVKGLVERRGKEDWYFVPQERRTGPVNGHRHGSEPIPEFIAPCVQ